MCVTFPDIELLKFSKMLQNLVISAVIAGNLNAARYSMCACLPLLWVTMALTQLCFFFISIPSQKNILNTFGVNSYTRF